MYVDPKQILKLNKIKSTGIIKYLERYYLESREFVGSDNYKNRYFIDILREIIIGCFIFRLDISETRIVFKKIVEWIDDFNIESVIHGRGILCATWNFEDWLKHQKIKDLCQPLNFVEKQIKLQHFSPQYFEFPQNSLESTANLLNFQN